ncbi:mediator complex, subunit Med18 [Cladochytrium replicatum]|nr:mediator complex, subunit Med18 [Cladochytrium replicatum]
MASTGTLPTKRLGGEGFAHTAYFQCSMHGIIADAMLPTLLERLVGVCGNVSFDGGQNFAENEIVYWPAVATPFGPARNEDMVVRLKTDLLNDVGVNMRDRKWRLCQYGPPEPPRPGQPLANYRSIFDIEVDGDAFAFVELLGYTRTFEFIRKGFRFAFNGMFVLIYRIFQVPVPHDIASATPLDSLDSVWIVEAVTRPMKQETIPKRSEDLFTLASYLTGLVDLQVMDHNVLSNKIKYTQQ